MSLQEALDSYKHISLTQDEFDAAILQAKQKKEAKINEDARLAFIEENRRKLINDKWTYEQTRYYALYRAGGLFGGAFKIDANNEFVFDMLCYYFSNDSQFSSMAKELGLKNPSLEKGILLAGNFGVGKTWLMKLFGKNKRQVYHIHNAKDISNEYEKNGQDAIDKYLFKYKNAVNDKDSFYHRYAGLCLDDIGTEDVKVNYGNRKSVIGDIMEQRYSIIEKLDDPQNDKNNCGLFLHGTTNLNAAQLTEYYGGRVVSRMREIFNFIELPGNDRRV